MIELKKVKESNSDFNKKILAGVLSSVLSSLAWISEQEAVLKLSPLMLASLAPIMAALIIYLCFPFARKIDLAKIRLNLKDFLLIVFVRNTIGFYVFVWALLYTSSAKVMFLTKMEPYLVLTLHWIFYGEKINRSELFLLGIHILGALMLSSGAKNGFSFEQFGDILVFIGLLASASVYRPGKKLAEELGSLNSTMVTNLTSGLIFLPFAIYFNFEKFKAPTNENYQGFLYLIVTVLLYYLGSTALWFYSLKGSTAWLMSAVRCLGPLVAAPVAWYFFGKTLNQFQIVGASIVIFTSCILVFGMKKKVKNNIMMTSVGYRKETNKN